MYLGINLYEKNLFTAALIGLDREVYLINHFWKEGLYWFLEHSKIKTATLNINFKEKNSGIKFRYLTELMNVLLENFEFEQLEIKGCVKDKRLVSITDSDLFFEQAVRKQLLPIETREGVEQRIYTLPKSGIVIKENLFSSDIEKLRSEVNAVVAAFTSLSIHTGVYSIKDIEGIEVIIPQYRYIPKSERKL